ncbi:MAG: restriction endonuclease [Chloroflexota bacterium]|nr:restriction endonuclease [Chloroflexota bacterium]
MDNRVGKIMALSDEQLEVLQDPKRGGRSKFGYRLAWTRTYLRKYGLIENSSRAVWALTQQGRNVEQVVERDVVREVKAQMKAEKEQSLAEDEEPDEEGLVVTWNEELLSILINLEPSAFERLTKRLLREAGFTQVEVTGRSGDAGIDGKGILKMGDILSLNVIFQCKKWRGSVGPGEVRDFRGAMIGRADKGLFITTGTFTKSAKEEATRDGAPLIDLIDGELLVELLKKYSLGVSTELVEIEKVTIDSEWYAGV